MPQPILRVSEYLILVNHALAESIHANEFLIEGEVSDYRVAQNKWVSFDLKDETVEAVLKCFMTTWQLQTPLENGMRVRIMGYPKIYERFGTFKLNVQTVEPVGEGALKRAYELLKKKLADDGLFDASRKRPLPRFPERIGLITSRDAAAYGDFLRILKNRWSDAEIDFIHVHVQGKEAVGDILSAFAQFATLPIDERPEAIVLTRGGGGLEDLHAFNDERVVRAIFQSPIPVVCGIGHERDESLCDFVADVRASTPSNAAERVVPNSRDVLYEIANLTRHAEERLRESLARKSRIVDHMARGAGMLIAREQERVDGLTRRFRERADGWFLHIRGRFDEECRVVAQLDPTRILSRGYSLVTIGGRIVKDASQLDIGKEVTVQLGQGSFDADVLRIGGRGKQKLV